MGRVHVENLVRLALENQIDFTAIGDRHPAATNATLAFIQSLAGHEFVSQLQIFECPRAMAERARLDATVVASRIADHFEDVSAFAGNRVRVLVEKPMFASVAQAAQLADELGENQNQLVQVGFQRHYDPAARVATNWFRDGQIGKLQQSHHVIQDKNPTPPGYQSGGITADMAVHLVFESMSFHEFQLPRFVQALRFSAPYYEDRASEGANVVHCFCSWANGSLAHLWGSRINATGYDNGFKLIGTEGRIDVGEFVGDFGPIHARLWTGTGEGPIARGTLTKSLEFPMTQSAPHHPDFYSRYAAAFAAELQDFVQHVQEKTPFELGPDIGWKTLLVANLADISARQQGQRFELAVNGRPIETVDHAAEYASVVGL